MSPAVMGEAPGIVYRAIAAQAVKPVQVPFMAGLYRMLLGYGVAIATNGAVLTL